MGIQGALHRQLLDALVDADAVRGVDDVIAGRELRQAADALARAPVRPGRRRYRPPTAHPARGR